MCLCNILYVSATCVFVCLNDMWVCVSAHSLHVSATRFVLYVFNIPHKRLSSWCKRIAASLHRFGPSLLHGNTLCSVHMCRAYAQVVVQAHIKAAPRLLYSSWHVTYTLHGTNVSVCHVRCMAVVDVLSAHVLWLCKDAVLVPQVYIEASTRCAVPVVQAHIEVSTRLLDLSLHAAYSLHSISVCLSLSLCLSLPLSLSLPCSVAIAATRMCLLCGACRLYDMTFMFITNCTWLTSTHTYGHICCHCAQPHCVSGAVDVPTVGVPTPHLCWLPTRRCCPHFANTYSAN